MVKKIKIGQSLNWVNEVLVDIIKRELEKGKNEEEIKNWLISYGFKPIDFKNEFKYLAPQIGELSKNKNISGEKTKKSPAENKRKIRLAPLGFALTVISFCTILFQYPKEIKNIGNQTLNFAKINTYDKIFKKNGNPVISMNNTETSTPTSVKALSGPVLNDSTTSNETSGLLPENPTSSEILKETTSLAKTEEINTESLIKPENIDFASAISQSKTLWNSAKYNEALAKAETALEKARNEEEKSKARYWIGLSYYSLGKKAESKKEVLMAIGLNPKYEPPYVTLAAIELDENNCGLALNYSQKALELNPNDFWNLNNLGLSYLCLGDKENALTQLRKAVFLAPDSFIIKNNLELAMQK